MTTYDSVKQAYPLLHIPAILSAGFTTNDFKTITITFSQTTIKKIIGIKF